VYTAFLLRDVDSECLLLDSVPMFLNDNILCLRNMTDSCNNIAFEVAT